MPTATFSQLAEAQKSLSTQDPLLREGVCLACSAQWIKLVVADYKNGVDKPPDGRMKLLGTQFDTIVNSQRLYGQNSRQMKTNGIKVLDRTNTALSQAMMVLDDQAFTTIPQIPPKMVAEKGHKAEATEQVVKAFMEEAFFPNTHHLLLCTFTDPGQPGDKVRHALGASRPTDTGGLLYFDPNQGEFVVKTPADLQQGLAEAAKVYGSGYRLKTLRLLEVGIGQPALQKWTPDD